MGARILLNNINPNNRFLLNNTTKRLALACFYLFVIFQILMVYIGGYYPSIETLYPVNAAYRIPAAELMNRPLPNSNKGVPKVFHQSWSSSTLPAKFGEWSKTCREKHPGWEYVLWTDDDNLKLLKMHMPWLLELYQNLKGPIYKADMIRNLYMFLFGGVYADLDTECLRDSSGIFTEYNIPSVPYCDLTTGDPNPEISGGNPFAFRNVTAFFGRLGTDNDFENSIPNAWMASEPRHPFFLLHLKWAKETILSKGVDIYPEAITGPMALRSNIMTYGEAKYHDFELQTNFLEVTDEDGGLYPEAMQRPPMDMTHNVVVLPFQYIYPYSHARDGDAFRDFCWVNKPTFNATRCKQLTAVDYWPSYSITYWSHTWTEDGHDLQHVEAVN